MSERCPTADGRIGGRARQLEWLTDGGLAELADTDERATVWR
jgi:hypothetical protein